MVHTQLLPRGNTRAWHIKRADDAASGSTDQSFEQALSSLAHTFIRDKCPRLLDYEVGFQLIDRNDDNTYAAGAFAFKLGNKWLYMPVFYLNGAVKGVDMLYIKDQDQLVPASEKWINRLLGKKPMLLGEEVPRGYGQLGVQQPNMAQLARTPMKYASTDHPWRLDSRAYMAYWTRNTIADDPAYATIRSLPEFVEQAGPRAVVKLASICKACPDLLARLDEMYGRGALEAWAKAAATRKAESLKREIEVGPNLKHLARPKVTQHVSGDYRPARKVEMSGQPVYFARYRNGKVEGDLGWESLTESERSDLASQRLVVRDHRTDDSQVSRAYDLQLDIKLSNPDQTGLYRVLMANGEYEHCLVITAPASPIGHRHFCVVVSLKTKKWVNIHPSKVWTCGQASDEAWRDWVEAQDKASATPGKLQVFFSWKRTGCVPVRIYDVVEGTGDDGPGTYAASWYDDATEENGSMYSLPESDIRRNQTLSKTQQRGLDHYGVRAHRNRVHFGLRGSKFVIRVGEVCIPADAHSLDLGDGDLEGLGSAIDLELFADQHSSKVRLRRSGSDIQVEDLVTGDRTTMDKDSAIVHLVKDKGLRHKTASVLVDEARAAGLRDFRLVRPAGVVKQAAPGPANLIDGAPNAPSFPDPPIMSDPFRTGVSAEVPYDFDQRIPEMSGAVADWQRYNPLPYADPQTLRVMMEASQTGQREVLDTAALASLLHSEFDDNLVDQWRPDLMKGMDRVGRILLGYYSHRDKFAQRYGKQDLTRIEDGLRNTFDALGKLVLDLDQRDITPAPDEDTSNSDEDDV